MKTQILYFLFALFFIVPSFSHDLSKSFPKGSGSKFKMFSKNGGTADISVYIADAKKDILNVEYFIVSFNSLIPVELWQQYVLVKGHNSMLKVTEGYIKSKELSNPEILTKQYFKNNKGVQISDFIFQNKDELNKYLVGDEKVEVPAGSSKATHYRVSSDGQTIDFWISDEARPIGLVKLVSASKNKPEQNYTLALLEIMKNVKAMIDPSKAKPLSEKGKSLITETKTKP